MAQPSLVDVEAAWSRLARGRLLKAMRAVEALPANMSGAFIVGHRRPPEGMVLVERNRICWAAATGMARRLRDILRSHAHLQISDGDLEALYVDCRKHNRPLGEALVTEGLVSAEHLRAAMKQHTVESLMALDAAIDEHVDELPLTWVEHHAHGYNPRYTFTATEVLAALGAWLLERNSGDIVDAHLGEVAGTGCTAIAFSPGPDGAPLLVGALTTIWLRVHDLVDLASWADAALAASSGGFATAVAHACAQSNTAATVAWSYEGQRYAAICPGGPALKRLATALDRQSLSLVLATKLSVLERVNERMSANPE